MTTWTGHTEQPSTTLGKDSTDTVVLVNAFGAPEQRQGWQCPLCKRVWSPDIHYCDCQKHQDTEPWKPWPNSTGDTYPIQWTYLVDQKGLIVGQLTGTGFFNNRKATTSG